MIFVSQEPWVQTLVEHLEVSSEAEEEVKNNVNCNKHFLKNVLIDIKSLVHEKQAQSSLR
jgi:hypothetical protein